MPVTLIHPGLGFKCLCSIPVEQAEDDACVLPPKWHFLNVLVSGFFRTVTLGT